LAGEILKSGSNISEITHSHPNSPSIPALGASVVSQADINNAQYFKNNYPSQKIIFRSYNVGASKYDYYNEKGVYRHEKKNK
jgi:ADP-ribosylglycohydrolase